MGGEVRPSSPGTAEPRGGHARGQPELVVPLQTPVEPAVGHQWQKREGLVCICAECKKVIKIVGEVTSDSAPVVSHGICPECAQLLYGDLFRKRPDR